MKKAAMRWMLVTFCVGITCGTLGHYLADHEAAIAVLFTAITMAFMGGFAVDTGREG